MMARMATRIKTRFLRDKSPAEKINLLGIFSGMVLNISYRNVAPEQAK